MKKSLWFSAKLSLSILSVCALCFCIFSNPLTRSFIEDAQTVAFGSVFLKGMSLSVPFLALDFLAVGVFQAVGKGSHSLLMAGLRKVIFEIPALYVLNFMFPLHGLAFAQLFAEVCMSVIGTILLLKLLKQIENHYA